MLYPLKLKPVYKEPIWGGKNLKIKFGKDIPSDSTGESWEVACHKNGTSTVANGKLKDKSLKEVMEEYGVKLLGTHVSKENTKKFPLLVKLLDASDKLSVQVHPDNDYAFEHENGELGKTEMWYIIDAQEGAKLIYGVKPGTTKEMFKQGIIDGCLGKYLNYVDVNKGDVFYISSTTLHAIGEGILLAEIQQNSDATYRVYDWNRLGSDGKPRELHVEKALDVTNLSDVTGDEKVKGLSVKEDDNIRTYYVACDYFATETIDINSESKEYLDGEKFDILLFIEGQGNIKYYKGKETFKAGDSFLIPASIGNYSIVGKCKVIKTYVPNIEKDIIKPLIQKGFSRQDLNKIKGIKNK